MPDALDEDRHEAVADALATGLSARAVARLQEREVRAILTEEAKRCFDGERLREEVVLEVRRVRTVSLKYYNKGLQSSDGELPTGIYLKGVERLMVMLGGNAPAQYSVHLIHQAAPAQTSTERLLAALDRLDAKATSPAEEEPPSGPN
jgi:hypothetical protein